MFTELSELMPGVSVPLGSAKLGWLKTLKNAAVKRCRVSKVEGPCSARMLSEFCGKAVEAKLKSV